ncbi:hypothetical protein MRX96_058583 [Rhipicephalus microplus]
MLCASPVAFEQSARVTTRRSGGRLRRIHYTKAWPRRVFGCHASLFRVSFFFRKAREPVATTKMLFAASPQRKHALTRPFALLSYFSLLRIAAPSILFSFSTVSFSRQNRVQTLVHLHLEDVKTLCLDELAVGVRARKPCHFWMQRHQLACVVVLR